MEDIKDKIEKNLLRSLCSNHLWKELLMELVKPKNTCDLYSGKKTYLQENYERIGLSMLVSNKLHRKF